MLHRLAARLARRDDRSQNHGGQAAPLNALRARRGLTLIELLVVIVLLLIVTTVAIPALAPNNEQRRIREAARLVSTFLSGARNRAIENGRPVGVQFERLTSNPNASMVLSYAEVPAMYAGDTLNATCTLQRMSATQLDAQMDANFTVSLVQTGDFFRANYQGHTFRIAAIDTSGANPKLTLDIPGGASTALPWPSAGPSSPMPYQITRQPIKAGEPPLQLPEGAAVDLSISGLAATGAFGAGGSIDKPIVVVFNSNGSTGGVYMEGVPMVTSSPVNFHIGRVDGTMPHLLTATNKSEDVTFDNPTNARPTRSTWNLRDLTNLWVSVNGATGLVSTTENAAITDSDAAYPLDFQGSGLDDALVDARAIARTFQSMGGR